MNKGQEKERLAELAHLRYLEEIHDFEGEQDRGPLSGKEVLIYSFEKTGTVTLYHSLGRHYQTARSWQGYAERFLHNHSNRLLVSMLKRSHRAHFSLFRPISSLTAKDESPGPKSERY